MLFESAGRNIHDGLRLVNRAMADEPPNKRPKMIRDPFQGPSDTAGGYLFNLHKFVKCWNIVLSYYLSLIFDILPSLLLAPRKFCVVFICLHSRNEKIYRLNLIIIDFVHIYSSLINISFITTKFKCILISMLFTKFLHFSGWIFPTR